MKGKFETGNSTGYSYINVTLRDRCYIETANPVTV